MTYFLTGNPQYHRRDVVSRSCSGWEGVGPTRYGRQEFWKKVVSTELCIAPCILDSRLRGNDERARFRMAAMLRNHARKVIESSRTGN